MTWGVLIHPEAEVELQKLPVKERVAVDSAMEKLRVLGPSLPYPHSSNVQCADNLRELRPRQGRCAWRAFYRKIGDSFVVGAIGPEAQYDHRGFLRAVVQAETRLDEVEDDDEVN